MSDRLMRPSAIFFPLALLISTIWGNHELVLSLMQLYLGFQVFGICASETFRNTASREPSLRRVDVRFFCALSQLIIGAIVYFLLRYLQILPGFLHGGNWVFFISAFFICLEQLIEERLFALGKDSSGILLAFLSSVLLTIGLFMDSYPNAMPVAFIGSNGLFTCIFLIIGNIIGVVYCLSYCPFQAFDIIPRNYIYSPMALLETMLYPAFYLIPQVREAIPFPAFLVGFGIWRITRTLCRRSVEESRILNFELVSICSIALVFSIWVDCSFPYGFSCCIAFLSAAIVFLAPSVRLYISMSLLAIALLTVYCKPLNTKYSSLIVIEHCLAALFLTLQKAFQRRNRRPLPWDNI